MRSRLVPPALLLATVVIAGLPATMPRAEAKPEFARREGKACGYCHINPRGGGARNETGLLYARSGFAFPERKGDLNDFRQEKDRQAMARARKLLDLQHLPAAITQLLALARTVKEPAARKLVDEELHRIDVKGWEILGQARRLLRGSLEARTEAVELLAFLVLEYKGLSAREEAARDLKEAKADKELAAIAEKEEREARARLAYLDAVLLRADGKKEKAAEAFRRVAEQYRGTRAAKSAGEENP